MKRLFATGAAATLLLVLVLAASNATAAHRTWIIDPDHFSIALSVDHAGYADVIGLFREAGGRFVYDPETGELR